MDDPEEVYRQVNACFKTSHLENNGWRLCNRLDVSNFNKLENTSVGRYLIDYEHFLYDHNILISMKQNPSLPLLYKLIWQFKTCNIYDVAINSDQRAVLLKLEKCHKSDDCTMYLVVQRGHITYDKEFDQWVEEMKSQIQGTEIHVELQVLREIPELWQSLTIFPQSKVHIKEAKYIIPEEGERLHHMKKVHLDGTQESMLSEYIDNSSDLESFRACDTEIPSMNHFTTKLEQHDHLQSLTIKNVITDTVQPIARLQQLSHLHLEGLKRSNISEAVFTLENLESLHIIRCQLEPLPQNVFLKMKELKTVDLSSNRLTVLPTSLVNLTKLETLILENNFLLTIDQIVDLKALRKLNLNSNLLRKLSKEISGLENLKSLSLNNNALEEFPKSVQKMKTLQELYLEFNSLSLFPEGITMLNSIKKLSLKGNRLKNVPSSIGNLKELQVLDLSENNITVLPQEIGGCINLDKLNINDNAIYNLPETMKDLISLQIMSIERNKLSAFPKVLSGMPSLKILGMEGNVIKEIPLCIKDMKSLETLGLNKTGISALPQEISQCHKLKQVWIRDNDIEHLPDSMKDLTSLELLSIQRNKLSTFPDAVVKMSSLKDLHLEGNNIKEIPPCIKEMESLEWLDMNNTGSTVLPDELSQCKKLRTLLISDNAIESLPDSMKNLTNLETLVIKRNKLSVFPSIVLKLSSLKELYLEENSIKEIPPSIREMKSLKKLDLAKAGISALPEEISYCKRLETLWIDDNAIENLPDTLNGLGDIKNLSMKRNRFSTFPSIVLNMPSLTFLNLAGNKIKEIPPDIRHLMSLEELNLKKNGILSIPMDISHCQKLKYLWLDDNDIEDLPTSLAYITNFEYLSVKRNKLTAFPTSLLTSALKLLYLEGNMIREIPPDIGKMQSLELLDLAETGISGIPEEISNCQKLNRIWIGNNNIIAFPQSMMYLPKLQLLFVQENKCLCLPTIPSSILGLKSLQMLELRDTGISILPEDISHYQKLKELSISFNAIEELPSSMKDLVNLEIIFLQSTKISSFPKVLLKMPTLKKLHLKGSKINTVPSGIKEMQSLELLNLDETGISTLPNEIGFLKLLQNLWIRNNDITSLPLSMKLLTSLQSLEAEGNAIKVIPDIFEDMQKMETLRVDVENVEYPPSSICREGVQSIAQFYKDYRGDVVLKNSREKINLIGETMVGKTSLARCLSMDIQGYMEQETKRTQVLETMLWKPGDNIEFKINDFGGHHIYKIMYHIFQTEKSINLIMYNLPRYDNFQQSIGFWFDRLLASYPGMSDVFIVGTRIDEVKQDEDICRKENAIKDEVNARRKHVIKRLDAEIQVLKKELKLQQIQEKSLTMLNQAVEREAGATIKHFKTMELSDQEHIHRGRVAQDVYGIGYEHQETLKGRQSDKVQGIITKLITKFSLRLDLQNMIFHFHAISCKTGQGLKEIHESLCDIGKSSCQQIPGTWQDTIKAFQKYFEETHNVSVDIEELFRVTHLQDSQLYAVIDKTDLKWRQFTDILSHLHYCGEILWYKQIKDLEDVIFPNIQRLINVLKAIFHHDFDSHLARVKSEYPSEVSFEQEVDSWRRCGKLSEDLLEKVFKSKGLTHVSVDAIKQLLVYFNIWYVFEPKGRMQKQSLLMPWFLRENLPQEVQEKWQEKQEEGMQYNVMVTFKFLDNIPETFFERMVVLCASTAASHCPDVYIWKDGLYCKVNKVQFMLEALTRREDRHEEVIEEVYADEDFPVRICHEIQLQSKGKDILGVWDVAYPLIEKISLYIQEQWPGLSYAAEMICPHCIQNKITPSEIIPKEYFASLCPEFLEIVNCRGEEIPAVLVRPVTSKSCSKRQAVVLQEYEDELKEKIYENGPLTQKIIVWLTNRLGPRYEKLATFLDVPRVRWEKIKDEYPRNVDRQIIEVLTYFRKDFMDKGKTNEECLQHLMKTLDECDLRQCREELERKALYIIQYNRVVIKKYYRHLEIVYCRGEEIPAVLGRPMISELCSKRQAEVLQEYEDNLQANMYENGPLTQKTIAWLANRLGARYDKLATFLEVPFERREKIKEEHPRNVDRQIIEVLTYFRKDFMDKGKTNEECLQYLMKTLDDCEMRQYREELERKLGRS